MGVSAYLVSLALLIALVFDALSDPLIGYVSDNTRLALGAAAPIHVCGCDASRLGLLLRLEPADESKRR